MAFVDDLDRLIASAQADNDAIERARQTLTEFCAGMEQLSKLIDHADEWRIALYQRIAATLPSSSQQFDRFAPPPRLPPEDEARLAQLAQSLTQPRGTH